MNIFQKHIINSNFGRAILLWLFFFSFNGFFQYFNMNMAFLFYVRLILTVVLINIMFKVWNLKKLETHERTIIYLLIFFIFYQLLQPFLNLNFSSVLVIPKYIYVFSFIIIIISDKKRTPDYKIKVTLSIIKIIFYLEFIFYFIEFIKYPSLGYRESRFSVLLGNANEDGGLLSTFYPLILFSYSNNKFKSILFIIVYFFVLYFMNGSRTSLIFSLLVTFLFFLKYSKYRKTVLFSFILIFSIYLNELTVFFQERIGNDNAFSLENYEDMVKGKSKGNLSGRIADIWMPTYFYVSENSPIIGLGNSSWNDVVSLSKLTYSGHRVEYRSPHNLFLVCFVDWGIIGLFFIFGLIFLSLKNLLKSIRQNIAFSVILSWIGFLGWASMANTNSIFGWSVFVLLISISIIVKTNENINYNTKLQLC